MIPHIARRSFGAGPRPVLAIHCTLGQSGAWRGLAALMGDELTFHAFDLPSHGRSGDWDGQDDLHDVSTAMARTVLDTLGPDSVDIIGHSYGATVALRLVLEAPNSVRSAILFEPVFFAAAIADDPGFAALYDTRNAGFAAAYANGDMPRAAQAFHAEWGGGTPWAELKPKMQAYMTERISFVYHSGAFLGQDSHGLLAPGQLDQVNVPLLLLHGSASPLAAQINGALARRLPCSEMREVDGVGHMAPISHPDRLAPHIRQFLSL